MPFHPTRREAIVAAGALGYGALLPGPVHARGPVQGPTEVMEGRAFASHWRVTVPAGQGIQRQRPRIVALLARRARG